MSDCADLRRLTRTDGAPITTAKAPRPVHPGVGRRCYVARPVAVKPAARRAPPGRGSDAGRVRGARPRVVEVRPADRARRESLDPLVREVRERARGDGTRALRASQVHAAASGPAASSSLTAAGCDAVDGISYLEVPAGLYAAAAADIHSSTAANPSRLLRLVRRTRGWWSGVDRFAGVNCSSSEPTTEAPNARASDALARLRVAAPPRGPPPPSVAVAQRCLRLMATWGR